jgi:hypothetical protein
MKLFSKITSERGKPTTKTANDYMEVELTFNRIPVGYIVLSTHEDADGVKGSQYLLTFKRDDDDEPVILREGHWNEGEVQSIYDEINRKRIHIK